MTENAYWVLMMAGLIAGPSSAFLVEMKVVPLYLFFPVIFLLAGSGKDLMRKYPVVLPPVLFLVWSVVRGDGVSAARAARWTAAVLTGVSMSGSLDAVGLSKFLSDLSGRVRLWGLTESLAHAVKWTGPLSKKVRMTFAEKRKAGAGRLESVAGALESLGDVKEPAIGMPEKRSPLHLVSAVFAWCLLLAAVAGVL